MNTDQIKPLVEHLDGNDLDPKKLQSVLSDLDVHFMAASLHQFSPENKVKIFQGLVDKRKKQQLIYETDRDSRKEIVSSVDIAQLSDLLSAMDEDEATDILKELSPETREEVLGQMEPRSAHTILQLIRFEGETAGGLMNPNYYTVSPLQTATSILMKIKSEVNHDLPPYFYVVDPVGKLSGYFKLRDLVNVSPSLQAREFIRNTTPFVHVNDPCEKVAKLMDNEHISAIPVVDDDHKLKGVITFDDVIRVVEDIANEEIFQMVGTPQTDPFAQRFLPKMGARIPWLLTTFVGGMASAGILHYFELSLKEIGALIFFIPFVLGLAGNVGIQGATILVRGLATGDIRSENVRKVVTSEILVGCSNGLLFGIACGLIIALISEGLLNSNPILGLAVGLGIFFGVATASFIGSLAPLIFIRLKIDPAISSGPLITVVNDVLGLVIYLFIVTTIYSIVAI